MYGLQGMPVFSVTLWCRPVSAGRTPFQISFFAKPEPRRFLPSSLDPLTSESANKSRLSLPLQALDRDVKKMDLRPSPATFMHLRALDAIAVISSDV
jgi:hypothetical protein